MLSASSVQLRQVKAEGAADHPTHWKSGTKYHGDSAHKVQPMQMPSRKNENPIKAVPRNNTPPKQSKGVVVPDYTEALLLFALAAKVGKVGLGSISPADVLKTIRTKHLQVTRATAYEVVIVESATDRIRISIRLTPGIIDTLLQESKRNPGALSPRCHDACTYLNNDSVKTKLSSLAGKRGATLTLSGNSIVFA